MNSHQLPRTCVRWRIPVISWQVRVWAKTEIAIPASKGNLARVQVLWDSGVRAERPSHAWMGADQVLHPAGTPLALISSVCGLAEP